MRKTLFVDINCIVIREKDNAGTIAPLSFRKGVFQNLFRIASELDYVLVLIPSNGQHEAVKYVTDFCANEDIGFADILSREELIARLKYTSEQVNKLVCKPGFADLDIKGTDILYLNGEGGEGAATSWLEVYNSLQLQVRRATVLRKTSETDISCSVNLDGSGENRISTGLGFFDHMLQQIARHGNMDLFIDVKGDLHIDEHHTIEDVGLALGAAFSEALGNKKGVERYGFLLPMDDCLAQVAIDFGGRPWLMWDATFNREKVGDVPTEMFYHFFKSFSDTARCNLNIKAEGSNEHHKIESIFKAFAKSIRMAVTKNGNNVIPSTKGSL